MARTLINILGFSRIRLVTSDRRSAYRCSLVRCCSLSPLRSFSPCLHAVIVHGMDSKKASNELKMIASLVCRIAVNCDLFSRGNQLVRQHAYIHGCDDGRCVTFWLPRFYARFHKNEPVNHLRPPAESTTTKRQIWAPLEGARGRATLVSLA